MTGDPQDRDEVERAFMPLPTIALETSPRWVRVMFGGRTIADSKRVQLLREVGKLPVYYFPWEDVRMELLEKNGRRTAVDSKGEAVTWTLQVGERRAAEAAWSFPETGQGAPNLSDYIAFDWDVMDAWYEEDDQVYVHPRDPYKRVDVLNSSRRVQVIVAGVAVADTRRPRLLYETGLPTRYYIPRQDVRMDLLVPSPTQTQCPYKGVATYFSVQVGGGLVEDIAWVYPFPIPECPKIENLVCFYNERVEALIVDGETQEKPLTPWS